MTAQASLALRADRRWAVTGTPVQNGLADMLSLFRFIQVHPYSERRLVDRHIIDPWIKGDRDEAVERLKKLLQYIMLRRPSSIITLPERTDTVISLNFDAQERAEYQQSAQATINCLDDLLHSNATSGGYKNAVTKINVLRMACNLGCRRNSNPQDSSGLTNLPSRQQSVYDAAGPWNETMESSDTVAMIGACKGCGMQLSNAQSPIAQGNRSPSLAAEDSGGCGIQPWCSICLSNLSDRVEEGSELDATHLEDITVQAGVGGRQWPTKIRALLEDIQGRNSDTKWSVAPHSIYLPYRPPVSQVHECGY